MDVLKKILGNQCQIVTGSDVTAVKSGYRAYALMVRVDNTQIKSVTKVEADDGTISVVTDESWENVNLLASIDYIAFEDSITSITLNAATDSVMLYLEKIPS